MSIIILNVLAVSIWLKYVFTFFSTYFILFSVFYLFYSYLSFTYVSSFVLCTVPVHSLMFSLIWRCLLYLFDIYACHVLVLLYLYCYTVISCLLDLMTIVCFNFQPYQTSQLALHLYFQSIVYQRIRFPPKKQYNFWKCL